jgi:hypothetical protein
MPRLECSHPPEITMPFLVRFALAGRFRLRFSSVSIAGRSQRRRRFSFHRRTVPPSVQVGLPPQDDSNAAVDQVAIAGRSQRRRRFSCHRRTVPPSVQVGLPPQDGSNTAVGSVSIAGRSQRRRRSSCHRRTVPTPPSVQFPSQADSNAIAGPRRRRVDGDEIIPKFLPLQESMDSSCKFAMLWSPSSGLRDDVQGGGCLTFKGELRPPIAAAASVVLAGHRRRRFSSIRPWHPPVAAPGIPSLSPDVHPCHPLHPITATTNGSHANFRSWALLRFRKPKVSTVAQVS